jgi:hypothetical protein
VDLLTPTQLFGKPSLEQVRPVQGDEPTYTLLVLWYHAAQQVTRIKETKCDGSLMTSGTMLPPLSIGGGVPTQEDSPMGEPALESPKITSSGIQPTEQG